MEPDIATHSELAHELVCPDPFPLGDEEWSSLDFVADDDVVDVVDQPVAGTTKKHNVVLVERLVALLELFVAGGVLEVLEMPQPHSLAAGVVTSDFLCAATLSARTRGLDVAKALR